MFGGTLELGQSYHKMALYCDLAICAALVTATAWPSWKIGASELLLRDVSPSNLDLHVITWATSVTGLFLASVLDTAHGR